ncbi:MAG: hypothetical protein KDA96_12260 [Planctomycetaceae bacterium]|nr:hypothetical protein [Planctomycetaceae bacterium]
MKNILISQDLMLMSSVQSAVRAVGSEYATVSAVEQLAVHAADNQPLRLLMDLGSIGFPVSDLSEHVSADVLARSIAFGPHVHEAKLEAARSAGFGTVLSRGAFLSRVGQLLQEDPSKNA